jgi:hypothetical protein
MEPASYPNLDAALDKTRDPPVRNHQKTWNAIVLINDQSISTRLYGWRFDLIAGGLERKSSVSFPSIDLLYVL